MAQADDIRNYCLETYVKPSRLRGDKGVFIPVADVHKNLHLSDRYPAVSAALGSNIFEDEANIRRIHVDGPINGVSTIFAYLFIMIEKGEYLLTKVYTFVILYI